MKIKNVIASSMAMILCCSGLHTFGVKKKMKLKKTPGICSGCGKTFEKREFKRKLFATCGVVGGKKNVCRSCYKRLCWAIDNEGKGRYTLLCANGECCFCTNELDDLSDELADVSNSFLPHPIKRMIFKELNLHGKELDLNYVNGKNGLRRLAGKSTGIDGNVKEITTLEEKTPGYLDALLGDDNNHRGFDFDLDYVYDTQHIEFSDYNGEDAKCSVCLEEKPLNCRKICFCKNPGICRECLRKWLEANKRGRCPACNTHLRIGRMFVPVEW